MKAWVAFLPVAWMLDEDTGVQRLRVPATYLTAIVALIAAYLGAIFKMDDIACADTVECYNYSKLEWSLSEENALKAINNWTPKGRAAMALSSGLHIFSSFLFAQLFIFASTLLEGWYRDTGYTRMERISSWVAVLGRLFNLLYCATHCTVASMVVSGSADKGAPVAVGVLLVLALVLLITCALYIIGNGVYYLVRRFSGRVGGVRASEDGQHLHNKV